MLIEQLRIERMEAMKEKNKVDNSEFNFPEVKMNLLSTLIGEATKKVKEPADTAVIEVIKSFAKNINFSIAECVEKGITLSPEAKEQYDAELEILYSYLPAQLTVEEMTKIAEDVADAGASVGVQPSMKAIMAHFKDNYAGLYDGKELSTIVKQIEAKHK